MEVEKEKCTHDCNTCGIECSSRSKSNKSGIEKEPANQFSDVKNIIAVVSGKGGVGKSLVTSMMSVIMSRMDYSTAILDADITGPSIPKIFNINKSVTGNDGGMFPVETATGIKAMSVNLLLEDERTPVVWRGPVIAGTVKQFWTDVMWGDVDYMFIDMPPGTGDVPLTVFQSLPVTGVIIVTSPQDLVSMIVSKAVNMAKMMKIPVLGLVENMSYLKCPDCGKEINIFGASKIEQVAEEMNLDILARIPIDPKLATLCDRGMIEMMENDYLDKAAEMIIRRTIR